MNFKQLETFKVVTQTENFSEAALRLHCVQSAVTNQIKSLEATLKAPLFFRGTKGVRITPQGTKLLAYVDRLLAIRDEAKQAVLDEAVEGVISIAGHESVLTYRLPNLMQAFAQQFPAVKFHVQAPPVNNIKKLILNGQVDFAFVFEEPFSHPELKTHVLHNEPVVLVASPLNPLADQPSVMAHDLKNQQILFTESGCNYRNRFERSLIKAGAYPKNPSEFVSIETIKSCVQLNMGVAAISQVSVAKELAAGELIALNWQDRDLTVVSSVCWHKNKSHHSAANAFLETVCAQRD